MAPQALLDYIYQNQNSGFSKSEIENALRTAGWSDQDIAAGFFSIEHPPTSPAQAAAGEESSYAAEVARINAELVHEQPRGQFRSTVPSTNATGITGFLIRRHIVKDEAQANIVLVAVAVGALVLSAWLLWPSNPSSASKTQAPLTPTPSA